MLLLRSTWWHGTIQKSESKTSNKSVAKLCILDGYSKTDSGLTERTKILPEEAMRAPSYVSWLPSRGRSNAKRCLSAWRWGFSRYATIKGYNPSLSDAIMWRRSVQFPCQLKARLVGANVLQTITSVSFKRMWTSRSSQYGQSITCQHVMSW